MEVIVEVCCGLDVHQKKVVACLLRGAAGRRKQKEIRSFGTMLADLQELREWLLASGCTHVAMESTGVYWMPIYTVLEDDFELVVGNASHIRNVPGRKTDIKDSQWLAELCRHGLIRPSFVPPKDLRQLRDLLRYRRKLVESQATERNRLQRLLETANIKLASVCSDVFGVSGRKMLTALIEGDLGPKQMAQMAKGVLRRKLVELARALDGRVEDHHRFLLRVQLARIEQVEATIKELDMRIDSQIEPYRDQYQRLMEIPGIERVGAAVIIAELGVDMSVFPTHRHAAAWAGVSPGNNESAGKAKNQPHRRGNVHLTTVLTQAAIGASKKRGSYLRDKFFRLRARRGPKRAAMAIAHKILIAAYYILKEGSGYQELGERYLDLRRASSTRHTLVKRLEALGYEVSLSLREAIPSTG